MYKKIQYKKAFKTPKNKGVTTKKNGNVQKTKCTKLYIYMQKLSLFYVGYCTNISLLYSPTKKTP